MNPFKVILLFIHSSVIPFSIYRKQFKIPSPKLYAFILMRSTELSILIIVPHGPGIRGFEYIEDSNGSLNSTIVGLIKLKFQSWAFENKKANTRWFKKMSGSYPRPRGHKLKEILKIFDFLKVSQNGYP